MATKRKRGSSWEYVVRRSKVLPKPIYLTFDSEHSGDEYVGRLEALIDRGLVPPEFLERKEVNTNVQKLITDYVRELSMPESDKRLLDRLAIKIGGTKLTDVTYPWVEKWVSGLKRVDNLAPGTIRHYVGAFARCLDWAVRRGSLVANPLRMLPRRYATYTANDGDRREDEHRERRLSELEEKSIRKVIENYGEHIYLVFFDLALETAMRMREMFTLSVEQVDLEQRTVFLGRTRFC